MDKTKDYMYKEADAGNKELLSMLIYRPIARALLVGIFQYTSISPNTISFLSLCVAIVAAYCFAFFSYPMILIGVLLLHFVYALDMLDGQYARFKGLTSKFGRWFDPFVDIIKISFIFVALSFRVYSITADYRAFIWGTVALTNSFLTFYILNTRRLFVREATFEVKVKKNIYVGYEISLYWAISFFVVIHKPYLGLIALATIGAFSWIKCFVSVRNYYLKHKEEIEKIK